MRASVIFLSLIFGLLGCASSEKDMFLMPLNDNPNAHPAALSGDSMFYRKPMNRHPANDGPGDFYFKHCAQIDRKSFYSKTSYDCESSL